MGCDGKSTELTYSLHFPLSSDLTDYPEAWKASSFTSVNCQYYRFSHSIAVESVRCLSQPTATNWDRGITIISYLDSFKNTWHATCPHLCLGTSLTSCALIDLYKIATWLCIPCLRCLIRVLRKSTFLHRSYKILNSLFSNWWWLLQYLGSNCLLSFLLSFCPSPLPVLHLPPLAPVFITHSKGYWGHRKASINMCWMNVGRQRPWIVTVSVLNLWFNLS